MKPLSFLGILVLLPLTACISEQERSERDTWQREQRDAYEIYECRGLGFEEGTEPFGSCRLQLRAIATQQQIAEAQAASLQQNVIVANDDDDDSHYHTQNLDVGGNHPPQTSPQAAWPPVTAGTLKMVPR